MYLAIDAAVIFIPFVFSFHPRLRFDRHWRGFALACLLTAIPFLVWDIAFTQAGVWGFNPRYLTGLALLSLPIEEWLFFFCIPYACVFTFYCFGLIRARPAGRLWYHLMFAASVALFVTALLNTSKAYTFLTCLLTSIVLGSLSFRERPAWLPRAVIAYLVVLPFFFLSNGLLTGSWIEEEVVWYNDTGNLGMRMGTIPVEDSLYGFLLVLMNTMLFERYRRKTVEVGE
jgi:lycopene cyclase domain-containing protein